jgi:hypothetical protein
VGARNRSQRLSAAGRARTAPSGKTKSTLKLGCYFQPVRGHRGFSLLLAWSCIAAAAALVPAAPAAAEGAAVTFDRLCYDNVPGQMMTITGTGFAPGDAVDLTSTAGVPWAPVTADANGGFTVQLAVPSISPAGPGERSFQLWASSAWAPAMSATSSFMVANFAVATQPAQAQPGKIVQISFSGFPSGQPIFGHYVRRGKVRATKRYGIASGPCGTLKTYARIFPGKNPRPGTYRVQFDTSRRYTRTSVPQLVGKLQIFKSSSTH